MAKVEIKAPAKINIGLNIVSKRADGFHNIETIFYPISLFDNLLFEKADSDSFSCNNTSLGKERNNLIIKAKEVLEEEFRTKFPLKIVLEKNIPIGAGMGGGSSDAASALHSINILYDLNLSKEQLNNYALRLGSDVPFFLDPRPSFASGRGEILNVLDFTIDFPILIVNPGIHISTKWAFDNIKPRDPYLHLNHIFQQKIIFANLQDIITNDFEEVVFYKYPEIAQIKKDLLSREALVSMLTGSGSTVFGIFDNETKALAAESYFHQKYFTYLHTNK